MIGQHIEIISETNLAESILIESFGKLLDGLIELCASITYIC